MMRRSLRAVKLEEVKSETPSEVKSEVPRTVAKPAPRRAKREHPADSVVRESKALRVDDNDAGPYPQHARPSQEECYAAHLGLSALHPEVIERVRARLANTADDEAGCGSRKEVLDALVGTILSQNTTDVNSHRAFSNLKAAFPTWDEVRTSPPAPIIEAIRSGGLAEIKTGRIQAILETVHAERGECSLEHLRSEPDSVVKATLRRFKGVGAKTISCVLLFCLHRADFPVDTHVWKIALSLGWVPKSADRDGTYEHLNRRVPDAIKYDLHVLLVEHGKQYKNQTTVLRKLISGETAITESKPACVD